MPARRAGQRGAGSQTRVTTAPKAASLCSSRSREGRTSSLALLPTTPHWSEGSQQDPHQHAQAPPLLGSKRGAPARPALSLISALSNLSAHKCHHHLAVGVYRSLVTRKGLYPHPLSGLGCSLFCIFEESFLFLSGYNANALHPLSIQPALP